MKRFTKTAAVLAAIAVSVCGAVDAMAQTRYESLRLPSASQKDEPEGKAPVITQPASGSPAVTLPSSSNADASGAFGDGNAFHVSQLKTPASRDLFARLSREVTNTPAYSEIVLDGLDYPASQISSLPDAVFEFMYAYPQYFYWADTTVGVRAYTSPSDPESISLLRVIFGIIDDYCGTDLRRGSTGTRAVYWGEITNTARDDANIAYYGSWASRLNATDLQKVLLINSLLCQLASYDSSVVEETPDNSDAFQIAKLFRGGKVVCESYAKAFKYLCDSAGVDCCIVRGTLYSADGSYVAHAWNAVKLDGLWYTVDVTNNDDNDNRFLLLGQQDPVMKFYHPEALPSPMASRNYASRAG